jgi:phosphomannomutase
VVQKNRGYAALRGEVLDDIKFGTSGWRGVIADDFTFERARFVVAAIGQFLIDSGEASRGILVGYDTRFMGGEFAEDAASMLNGMGIDVLLCTGPVPTPTISSVIIGRKLGGAINFTASHNPPRYQGIKFSPSWGGPALPETTNAIEENVRVIRRKGLPGGRDVPGRLERIDPAPEYLLDLSTKVDLGLLARSGPEIIFDALYGTGAGYLDRILIEAGCTITAINDHMDPLFGGDSPEPSEERLSDLARRVSERSALGISTDGDADRFGIVGSRGEFYTPNIVLALLADYLLGKRRFDGDIARSVATTRLLDDIASAYGRRCHETPVGFKYIGQMISRNMLALGGEESAGMSIRNHIPEKDGILACLLVAEMVAATGKTLGQLKADLDGKYGPRFSIRINLRLTDELAARLRTILESPPASIGGHEPVEMVKVDGTKWVYRNGDWVLLRLSGTEPVARLYVEAASDTKLATLKNVFMQWVSGDGQK